MWWIVGWQISGPSPPQMVIIAHTSNTHTHPACTSSKLRASGTFSELARSLLNRSVLHTSLRHEREVDTDHDTHTLSATRTELHTHTASMARRVYIYIHITHTLCLLHSRGNPCSPPSTEMSHRSFEDVEVVALEVANLSHAIRVLGLHTLSHISRLRTHARARTRYTQGVRGLYIYIYIYIYMDTTLHGDDWGDARTSQLAKTHTHTHRTINQPVLPALSFSVHHRL